MTLTSHTNQYSKSKHMRIAFLGKGGSGKTSLAAGYISFLNQNHPSTVLAIDADHNTHLHQALSLDRPKTSLSASWAALREYVKGDRTDLVKDVIIGTTPPHVDSNFFRMPDLSSSFIDDIAVAGDNLNLIEVGSFDESDLGHNCYHGKLGGLNLFLSHLLDKDEERVVADSTAGLDLFGTPLLYAYDLLVVVVEPTVKSLEVYQQLYDLLGQDKIVVVGNKIESDEDVEFLKENISSPIIGHIGDSADLRAFEQGEAGAFASFVDAHTEVWHSIERALSTKERDWDGYFANLLKAYKKASEHWYDSYYGVTLGDSTDQSFSYKDVL